MEYDFLCFDGGQSFPFNFKGGYEEIYKKCLKNGLKWPKNIILKGGSTKFFEFLGGR